MPSLVENLASLCVDNPIETRVRANRTSVRYASDTAHRLTARVLRGRRCNFARLGHIGHRGGIAHREHVRLTRDLKVGLHLQPPSLGRQSQLLDQWGGGNSSAPGDGSGVDARAVAEYDVIGMHLVKRHGPDHHDRAPL